MAENTGIEMKFSSRDELSLARASRAFLSQAESMVRERNYTALCRYLDTMHWELSTQGISLRKMDVCPPYWKKPSLLIKIPQSVSREGALLRREYLFELPDNRIDFEVIRPKTLRQELENTYKGKLREIFATSVRRYERTALFMQEGQQVAIDICLDRVDYKKAREILQRDFEIELKFNAKRSDTDVSNDDGIEVLNQLKDVLIKQVPQLRQHFISRARRGYDLLQKQSRPDLDKRVVPLR